MKTLHITIAVEQVGRWAASPHEGRDDASVFIDGYQFVGTPDQIESLGLALQHAAHELRSEVADAAA